VSTTMSIAVVIEGDPTTDWSDPLTRRVVWVTTEIKTPPGSDISTFTIHFHPFKQEGSLPVSFIKNPGGPAAECYITEFNLRAILENLRNYHEKFDEKTARNAWHKVLRKPKANPLMVNYTSKKDATFYSLVNGLDNPRALGGESDHPQNFEVVRWSGLREVVSLWSVRILLI